MASVRESVRVESFEGFVEASLPRLVRFAGWVAGPSGDPEDLVQDALERTGMKWRNVGSGGGDPEAYVRRAIVNGNISRWRSRRREHLVDGLPDRSGLADAAEDPRHGHVWQAVATLPRGQRAIIALRFFEDMSVAQTAAVLGVSEGTVKTQSHRALDTLRERLRTTTGAEALVVTVATTRARTPHLTTAPGAAAAVADRVTTRRRQRDATVVGAVTAAVAVVLAVVAWSPWAGGDRMRGVVPAPSVATTTQPAAPTTRASQPSVPRTTPSGTTAPTTSTPAATVANTDPDTQPATGSVILTDLRIGRQEGVDRVVWQFDGDGAPGWDVRYTDNPTREGSGDAVDLPGDATLRVVLTGIDWTNPSDDWYFGPGTGSSTDTVSSPDTVVVTEVIPGARFEGQLDGFVGVREVRPFRVYLLENPTRVVVDIITD